MTKFVPEDKAHQGGWGRHGLRILIATLLFAFVAWGVAEIFGEMIRTNTAEQGKVPGS
ncbi:hypothetical protein [Mesorhizobium sp. INR15]|uniref:hypothetical protein n=1 Tax=Mesorhizobium sp. INR15 TaxID=2654248 RepID=UPI0018968DF7|nr:hypothetical protein [Mesorhizobium sp. INR15]